MPDPSRLLLPLSRRDVARTGAAVFASMHLSSHAGLLSGLSFLDRKFLKQDWDVIVVGAGAAGLAAALSALETDPRASVLILEKQSEIGGNSRISGGYFACVDPIRQGRQGITDSEEHFFRQLLENGGGEADPALCRTLVKGAGPALQWLESHGMRFQDSVIEIYGAHWPRVHKPLMPMGEGYVHALSTAFLSRGGILRTNVRTTALLSAGKRVVGVRAEIRDDDGIRETVLHARRGVVLTSGGFGANRRMIERYAPRLAGCTTNNTPGSTGEMLLAAEAAGARLSGMEFVQCMPGCPPGRTHRVRLHNDVSRFILVDHAGHRFIREDARRDVIRDAVLALPERYAYSIVDDEGLRNYNLVFQKEAVIGIETGDAWRGDSVGELAAAMGIDPAALEETVREYNRSVRSGRDPLGKSAAELTHPIRRPPFWGCYAGMTIHYTMGGIRISPLAQALDAAGSPIPGLWSAGEATSGVHGVNRMGANGLNDGIVFGRIAGRQAAMNRT